MTDPAKAAVQKVLTALYCNYDHEPTRCAIAAAAIRAAADVVVPEEPLQRGDQRWMLERDARQAFRCKLLAIAAELEAQP